MKTELRMKTYILISLLTLNFSCTQQDEEIVRLEGVDNQESILPQELVTLIDSCIRCGCHWRFNKDKENKVFIRYSKAYFSPDSSKVMTIVTHQINNVDNSYTPEMNFEIQGDAFIGFKAEEGWKLYAYEAMMPSGYYSYSKVENGMIDFFENQNYRLKHWVYTYSNNQKYRKAISSSPNEDKFWESILWKKNLEIDELYPFEIRRYNTGTERVKSMNELLEEC